MHTPLALVKVGGAVFDDAAAYARLLDQFARRPAPRILVHGGGGTATRLAERLGLSPKLIDGRRVTDAATLDLVVGTYAGRLNTRLVADLQARGCDALGLSGADGDVLRATRRPVTAAGVDFGLVGDVRRVNAERIARLLDAGLALVFCAITHDGRGQLLNTNADTVAAALAEALAPRYGVRLQYASGYAGVLADPADPASTIPEISPATYARLRAEGTVSAGMLPKLDAAFASLRAGVTDVSISGLDLDGAATRLRP